MELIVPVEGGHLWVDDSGSTGPSLALLHPGWGDSSIWLPLLESLASRFRVIRYDTRGYGRSPAPVVPFTQLDDLIAVLDRCGVPDVMLVGHSGGGGTAIALALTYPHRVGRLLLLAPGVPDYPWPLEDPYFVEVGKLFAARDCEGLAALGLRTWAACGGEAAHAQVREAAEAIFRVGDQERPGPPAYARLAQLRVPTIMVTGDRDYPMMIRWAQDIAGRIPGCRQIVALGADHLLPLRVPGELAELVDKLDRDEDVPGVIFPRVP